MACTLNRVAYQQLFDEDIAWAESMPRTVERDHVMDVLRWCREHRIDERPDNASVAGAPTGTEARVCADIAERQRRGIAKYGTTVASNPLELRQWLQHAYEEALDLAIYLRRAIEESERTPQ